MKVKTLWVAGVMMASSACTQGTPAGSSAGAGPGNPLAPMAISIPLNAGTHMKGQHETPPHDTQAQGQAIFQVSPDGRSVSYRLIASGIDNVVASHIHQGAVGVPGPAVVFLYGNAAPGAGRRAPRRRPRHGDADRRKPDRTTRGPAALGARGLDAERPGVRQRAHQRRRGTGEHRPRRLSRRRDPRATVGIEAREVGRRTSPAHRTAGCGESSRAACQATRDHCDRFQ